MIKKHSTVVRFSLFVLRINEHVLYSIAGTNKMAIRTGFATVKRGLQAY